MRRFWTRRWMAGRGVNKGLTERALIVSAVIGRNERQLLFLAAAVRDAAGVGSLRVLD